MFDIDEQGNPIETSSTLRNYAFEDYMLLHEVKPFSEEFHSSIKQKIKKTCGVR
jgi:hypothetical protein